MGQTRSMMGQTKCTMGLTEWLMGLTSWLMGTKTRQKINNNFLMIKRYVYIMMLENLCYKIACVFIYSPWNTSIGFSRFWPVCDFATLLRVHAFCYGLMFAYSAIDLWSGEQWIAMQSGKHVRVNWNCDVLWNCEYFRVRFYESWIPLCTGLWFSSQTF